MRLSFFTASTGSDIEAAFRTAARSQIEALLVTDKPFFTVRRGQIVALAVRYSVPAVYGWREYVAAGGLISYGSSLTDAWLGCDGSQPLLARLGSNRPRGARSA